MREYANDIYHPKDPFTVCTSLSLDSMFSFFTNFLCLRLHLISSHLARPPAIALRFALDCGLFCRVDATNFTTQLARSIVINNRFFFLFSFFFVFPCFSSHKF
jgi:hypothetical protein